MKKCVLLLLCWHAIGFANPENPVVVSGVASFEANGSSLNIEASDRSIIQWEGFSIGKGEATTFNLPSSQSAVLNRVCGGQISEIYGELRSNGSIYLINTHGIIIGKEGLIQTASFCGSTLQLADEEFLASTTLHFVNDNSSEFVNRGIIIGNDGDVIIIAPKIHNSGEVEALRGEVALGAGYEATYFPHGDEKISIKIQDLPPPQEGIAIHQEGDIHASQVSLKSDGNLYAYAIKNDGYIKATSLENKEGKVVLISEKGHVNHTGEIYGDEIHLLGDFVTLIEEAKVDASSECGGGTILVGGDYQGLNPDIMHAKVSLVEKGVELKADSIENGNGGKIIIWSDQATGFYGTASAQGGRSSGDGGFIEVSSKDAFEFDGLANTTAPFGKVGTLLLDPTDITISNAATDAGIVFGGACGANTYCNTGALSPRNIQIASILANLAAGNVIINSTPGGPAGGNGDITFSAGSPFTWTGVNANTFTLNARRNIVFADNFTNSTTAGNFTANGGLGVLGTTTINAGVTVAHSSAGTFTLNQNTTAGSDITINGILNVTGGNLSIVLSDDFTLAATPAALTFNSPGNTFSFQTTAAAGSVTTFTGPVNINGNATLTTSGTVAINDGFTTAGTGTLTMNSVGTITTGAASTIVHNSSGNLTINVTGAGSDLVLNGSLSVTGANLSITVDDDITTAAGTGTITYNAAGKTFTMTTVTGTAATLTLNGPVNVINGNVNWSIAGIINDNANITTAGAGTVTMTSTGAFNTAAGTTMNLGSTGDINLSTTGGSNMLPDGTITITGANATITTSGNFTLATTGAFNYSTAGKTLTFVPGAATNYTFNGPVSITGGNLSLTAANDIIIGPLPTGIFTYNVVGGSAVLTSVGGGDPDFTINGTFTVTNGSLTATTFDDITVGTTGTFNYNSPNPAILSATGTDGDIVMNGVLSITNGTMTMIAVDDITIAGTATHSSAGFWSMQTTGGTVTNDININGNIDISNGLTTMQASGAIVFGGATTTMTYTSPLAMTAVAERGSITINKFVNLTTAAPFTMTATLGDININNLVRNFSTGNLTATAGGIFMVGDEDATIPSVFGTAGGITRITTGGNFFVTGSETTAGATGFVGFISGGLPGSIILSIGANALIEPNTTNSAGIQSPTTLDMVVVGDLSLSVDQVGTATGQAVIESGGDMSIQAQNTSLAGFTNAEAHIQSTSGTMTLISQNNTSLLLNAHIRNLGTGALTIVVDQQAPLPFAVGPGQFNLLGSSTVSTNGGALGIFTALPTQNTIAGLINGLSLEDGNQIFGVWYSTFAGTSAPPFTVYYKIGGVIPPFVVVTTASSEMIQEYFERMMGLGWMNQFFACTPYDFNIYSIYYRKPFEYPINLPWVWSCPPLVLEPIEESF